MSRWFSFALPILSLACGNVSAESSSKSEPDAGVEASVPDGAAGATGDASTVDAPADAPPDVYTGPPAAMTLARSLFGAVGDDSRVRVFSGLTELGLVSAVEAYDENSNDWVPATSGTFGRYGHTVARAQNGDVYVISGTSNGKTPIGSVEVYSVATDAWSTAPDLPTPRIGLAAATAQDGRIYAIGGGLPGLPSDVVEVYSPDTKTWTAGPSLPTARLSLQAVTAKNGRIYAIAGRDANTVPLDVVEALDPETGKWTTEAPLKVARYWFGATLSHDGSIVVAGGVGMFGFLDSVEAFQPSDGWSERAALPEPRGWLSLATAPSGRVLAIGGSTNDLDNSQPPPLATMFAYDIANDAWTK